MSFGGDHPAHGLQSGQAPRGRRLRHLDGRADNGMLYRTGPGFQNREQVGAEPQAEAAGPARPAAALPKTPTERTDPSWRNYRNTSPSRMAMAFAYFSARRWSFSVMRGSLDRSLLWRKSASFTARASGFGLRERTYSRYGTDSSRVSSFSASITSGAIPLHRRSANVSGVSSTTSCNHATAFAASPCTTDAT